MTSELESLLARFDPNVRDIALHARDVIHELLPDTIEQVDQPARLVAYGRDRTLKGLICGLALQKSYVNLMFARGTRLEDPDGLLVGTGKLARHATLRSADDIDRPAVRDLVAQAGRLTP